MARILTSIQALSEAHSLIENALVASFECKDRVSDIVRSASGRWNDSNYEKFRESMSEVEYDMNLAINDLIAIKNKVNNLKEKIQDYTS